MGINKSVFLLFNKYFTKFIFKDDQQKDSISKFMSFVHMSVNDQGKSYLLNERWDYIIIHHFFNLLLASCLVLRVGAMVKSVKLPKGGLFLMPESRFTFVALLR